MLPTSWRDIVHVHMHTKILVSYSYIYHKYNWCQTTWHYSGYQKRKDYMVNLNNASLFLFFETLSLLKVINIVLLLNFVLTSWLFHHLFNSFLVSYLQMFLSSPLFLYKWVPRSVWCWLHERMFCPTPLAL